jgi:DNA polymerase-3 subunit delta'
MTTTDRLKTMTGLEGAKRAVLGLAQPGSAVHAVLLYGVPGGGTTALAGTLAQAWLCRQPGPEGACGECQSCRAYEREKNADLLELYPQGKSYILKLGAIVPSNDKETLEQYPTQLKPFFRTMPIFGRHKVAILHDADRMNGDAANALLKTLEEPHPHAKLVLTTTSVGSLLPTIRSRCLAVACSLPSADALRDAHPEAMPEDLVFAEGAPGRLEEILRDPAPYRDLATLARSLPKRRRADALVLTESLRGIAERLEKTKGCNARTANAEVLALLATWVARDANANPRWTSVLADAHRRILQNGSPTVVLDSAFAKMLR